MSDTSKKTNQEEGDEVLRRLLKTPPDPKTGKAEKPHKDHGKKFLDLLARLFGITIYIGERQYGHASQHDGEVDYA